MDDVTSYRAVVAASVVFDGVGGADLERILSRCQLVTPKPGDLILSEGTPGDGVYIVLEGQVEVFLPAGVGGGGRRPTRIRLATLGPGRCLGEYGVIDEQSSSASAVALSPAKLCFLPKAQFRALVGENDHLGRIVYANLLRYLISRLRSKDRELDTVLLDDKR
jgi:CRP-like cAMP-binding protein